MFDRSWIRGWIAVGWVVLFLSFGLVLQYVFLDKQRLVDDLNRLEKMVAHKDWQSAEAQMANLEKEWNQQKFYIQVANGSAEVATFTQRLSQAKTLVYNQQGQALGTIGELKELSKSVATVFPGP